MAFMEPITQGKGSTLPTPRDMAEEIVRKEGGLNKNPKDRGGITNYGVSLRYARNKGLDLDGDGDVDGDDILLVTPPIAVELFLEDFLTKPRLNRAPLELQSQLFDMSVNHGPGNSVMILQRLLNSRYGAGLKVDGGWGPNTQRATFAAVEKDGWRLVNNWIVGERLDFFADIVERDPSQEVFIRGWRDRGRSFIVKHAA